MAIAWPLMLMAHFALFTFIAPFLREAGLPDYSITLSLTVLGSPDWWASGSPASPWICGRAVHC